MFPRFDDDPPPRNWKFLDMAKITPETHRQSVEVRRQLGRSKRDTKITPRRKSRIRALLMLLGKRAGLTVAELSAAFDISIGGVKNALHVARTIRNQETKDDHP